MRLLVTGPLGISHRDVINAINASGFKPTTLVMTEEFSKAHLMMAMDEGKTWESIISIPLSEADFGPCAVQVRHLEMVNQSDALLVIEAHIDEAYMPCEPTLLVPSVINLAKKSYLDVVILATHTPFH